LRGEEFVTRKITVGLAKIINKYLKCLYLGNIDSKRDWGYAEDYVEAMWLMMQRKTADDFVIATNKSYSVKDFINEAGITDDVPMTVSVEMANMTKKIFEYKGIPQVMVYNQHKILQQTFYKKVDIDSLQYYLKN
jgi:GDPmannose 4,6-dehydratase